MGVCAFYLFQNQITLHSYLELSVQLVLQLCRFIIRFQIQIHSCRELQVQISSQLCVYIRSFIGFIYIHVLSSRCSSWHSYVGLSFKGQGKCIFMSRSLGAARDTAMYMFSPIDVVCCILSHQCYVNLRVCTRRLSDLCGRPRPSCKLQKTCLLVVSLRTVCRKRHLLEGVVRSSLKERHSAKQFK